MYLQLISPAMWSPRIDGEPRPNEKVEERNPLALSSPLANDQPLLPQQTNDVAAHPSVKPPRLQSLDLMRGSIMVIMAWDHCKDIISNGNKAKTEANLFKCLLLILLRNQ